MINDNIVGYCFSSSNTNRESPYDIGELLTRILLFDTTYLKSSRLNEIGALVQTIGAEQTIELLDSGLLKIVVDSLMLASVGQNAILESSKKRGCVLSPGNYSFAAINVHHERKHSSELLANTRPVGHRIDKNIFKRLKLAVVNNIIDSPDKVRYSMNAAINHDLRCNTDVIPYLIKRKLSEKKNTEINISDIKVKTHELNEKDFNVETNLNQLLGLEIHEEHEIVQGSLLALGNFNQMLLEMEAYDSITVFSDNDYSLFDKKYKFLSKELVKTPIQSELSRVIEVAKLPDFSNIGGENKLNIQKLLEVKKSEEFILFRQFLKNSNKLNDNELKEVLSSFKSKVSEACHSPFGKKIRLLFGAGVGLVPILGAPLSVAVSIADQYLFEKVMPSNGIISFINRGYPSIFK